MHILLVDDHTLFREALLNVLQQLGDNVAVIDAANAREAVRLAIHYQDLDLILVDLALPDASGVSLLTELQKLVPTVPLVVLSASEDLETVRQALKAGAAGYIPKSSSSYETIAALRLVLQGEIYVPPTLLTMLDKLPPDQSSTQQRNPNNDSAELSSRQLEVLQLMAQGLPNKVIARQLDVAEGTVKLHVASILRALHVHNRTEAVVEAGRQGLLTNEHDTDTDA